MTGWYWAIFYWALHAGTWVVLSVMQSHASFVSLCWLIRASNFVLTLLLVLIFSGLICVIWQIHVRFVIVKNSAGGDSLYGQLSIIFCNFVAWLKDVTDEAAMQEWESFIVCTKELEPEAFSRARGKEAWWACTFSTVHSFLTCLLTRSKTSNLVLSMTCIISDDKKLQLQYIWCK